MRWPRWLDPWLHRTTPAAAAPTEALATEPFSRRVVYRRVDRRGRAVELAGLLFEPPGDGPFPTLVSHHGSERQPRTEPRVAQFWLDHGCALFRPLRSGHGGNPGRSVSELGRGALAAGAIIRLHEAANADAAAAEEWIRAQPAVDPQRLAVVGASFGGIQTLLSAERAARQADGPRCYVAFSACERWNPAWAERLARAVRAATAPVLFLQAANDHTLGPSEALAPVLAEKGPPNRHCLLPAYGDPANPAHGHAGFFGDPGAWGPTVLAFLRDTGVLAPATPTLRGAVPTPEGAQAIAVRELPDGKHLLTFSLADPSLAERVEGFYAAFAAARGWREAPSPPPPEPATWRRFVDVDGAEVEQRARHWQGDGGRRGLWLSLRRRPGETGVAGEALLRD